MAACFHTSQDEQQCGDRLTHLPDAWRLGRGVTSAAGDLSGRLCDRGPGTGLRVMGLTDRSALGQAASGEALASSGTDLRCFRSCNGRNRYFQG